MNQLVARESENCRNPHNMPQFGKWFAQIPCCLLFDSTNFSGIAKKTPNWPSHSKVSSQGSEPTKQNRNMIRQQTVSARLLDYAKKKRKTKSEPIVVFSKEGVLHLLYVLESTTANRSSMRRCELKIITNNNVVTKHYDFVFQLDVAATA